MAVPPDDIPEVRLATQFESFYREEFAPVVAVSYALTRDRGAAEEIAQEAFYRALRRWGDVGRMAQPGAWVRRVAINLAISRFRKLRYQARAMLRLVDVSNPQQPEVDEFWTLVGRLPRRQAQTLALHYVEDMSISRIGDVLGIAEGTVKALLHQGRERVRRQLASEGMVDDAL